MAKLRFSFILKGIDVLSPHLIDALHAHGCDDAVFGSRDRTPFADFVREADSLPRAVLEALEAVERAVPGAQVVRVAPDDLVSLTEISARTGRTKESIRLLAD